MKVGANCDLSDAIQNIRNTSLSHINEEKNILSLKWKHIKVYFFINEFILKRLLNDE